MTTRPANASEVTGFFAAIAAKKCLTTLRSWGTLPFDTRWGFSSEMTAQNSWLSRISWGALSTASWCRCGTPGVPNLLEAFGQGQTSISLARKGDTQAVVLSLTADAPYALELRKHLDMYMPDPQRLQALLRAMPQWMETAAEPEQFPNLIEGLAITDVSVSIVFDAMLPNLSQLLAKKLGANGATLH